MEWGKVIAALSYHYKMKPSEIGELTLDQINMLYEYLAKENGSNQGNTSGYDPAYDPSVTGNMKQVNELARLLKHGKQ